MSKKYSLRKTIYKALPGLFICITIAILSKVIAVYIPSVGAPTLSILIGIIVGNALGSKEILNKGTKFCESTLLSVSIVLLGGSLSISTILHIGINGLAFIILEMALVIIGAILIGKAMNFSEDFYLLMASGNAVCGSSAIASTAPVIHAGSRDKGISITMVNVTGTVLMLLLPLITSVLYNNSVNESSAMIGGILQSVGQAVACGDMVSEEVKDLATIYKIVRVIFIVLVVIILATIKDKSTKKAIHDLEDEIHPADHHKSPIKIPWYIIGFFITCLLHSFGIISTTFGSYFKLGSSYLEIIALAGIGMRVYIKDLLQQGAKTSVYCVLIAAVQIVSAIVLIRVLL